MLTLVSSVAGSFYQHLFENGGKDYGRFLVLDQAVPAIVGCMPGNMDGLIIAHEQNMPVLLLSGTCLQVKTADSIGNAPLPRNGACEKNVELVYSELALYTPISGLLLVELSSENSRKSRETVKHLLHGLAHNRIEHPIRIELSDYPRLIACNNLEAYAGWSRCCLHIMDMGAIVRQNNLLDWESAAILDESDETRKHVRCCTRAFLSYMALEAPNQGYRHTVEDGMESMLYVLMYCSVRWLPHKTMSNPGRWMHNFFHDGIGKGACVGSMTRFTDRVGFDNSHISAWFESAFKDLSTTSEISKEDGIKVTWTIDNVRKLWEAACQELPGVGEAENDRVEHDITYYRGY